MIPLAISVANVNTDIGNTDGPIMQNSAAELRSFNRFYTKRIGLLNEHITNSPFSLAEARVLYELAQGTAETAAELSRLLGMDTGYLSRMLTRLKNQGLVESRVSPHHAKHRLLSLTPAGRQAFETLDNAAAAQMEGLLTPLNGQSAAKLVEAARSIRAILGDTAKAEPNPFILREPQIGDIGWVIHRQAVLYHREYGWDWRYEGLIAGILGRFIENYAPERERCWIAERDGQILGSIFLVDSGEEETGQLRLLYVDPTARGQGIGAALVAACIEGARNAGYRRLMLWTNDILVAARRLYEAAGFTLAQEQCHHSFGHDLVGQTWILDLA